jgi:Uma2 family endonuclease
MSDAIKIYEIDSSPVDYTRYAAIEERVQVIDGEVYEMSSPTVNHQSAAGEIFYQIKTQLKGKPCRPFIAPLDVRLFYKADDSDTAIVQPDIMIVCDKNKIDRGFIKGAPDFVLEVLSESTRRMDMLYKTNLYARAGVKEYWILDVETRALNKGALSDDGKSFNFEIIETLGTIALNTQSLSINFDEVFPAEWIMDNGFVR